MDTLTGLLSLLSLFLSVQSLSTYDDKSPMVAFMCNRPSMYRSAAGWIKDDSTDCLKAPVEILNYCRKVYPNLDVRNVVEAGKKVTITKWCGFGHNKCHHEFTVRPFRCLVGPFQSDALLVPEHCIFDHIHDSKECKNFEDWNKTSIQACDDRGMELHSFAILQPCGIDRFNGVEFVCCPEEDDVDLFLHKEFEYFSTTSKPQEKPVPEVPTTTTTTTTTTTRPSTHQPDPDLLDNVSVNDIYNKYLHQTSAEYMNEHEYFMKAKNDLEKHHHEKVTKMMKEWAEARQHVLDLKDVDPKGSEKLNKEITSRFQKTYQALEQEGMAEKKQLVALHQQRIQAALNEKKRHAMEHYMDVLTDDDTDAARILKGLQHYLKAEQKDRLHSINHFKHLRDTDPAEAEAVREQTLNHLDLIQARIQQAVDMLNRVPKYQKKITSQIEDYLSTFTPLDASITELLSRPVIDPEDVLRPADVVKQYQLEQQQQQQQQQAVQEEQQKEIVAEKPETASPEAPQPSSTPPPPSTAAPAPVVARKEYYDEEVMEDEHNMVIQPQPLHGDSFHADPLEVNSYIKQERVSPVNKFSAPTLAIAIGSVTVFVVIVVGIIVLRKRAQRVQSTHGFVEVDQAGSPEERHVANMQMNGYENPTYKYFEMNGNA